MLNLDVRCLQPLQSDFCFSFPPPHHFTQFSFEVPGLYFFYNSKECLYVGQSQYNIYKRAKQPCTQRKKALQGERVERVFFLPLSKNLGYLLEIYEGWCIYHFLPKRNRLNIVFLDIFKLENIRRKATSLSKKEFARQAGICITTYSNKHSQATRQKQKWRFPPGCCGFQVDTTKKIIDFLKINIEDVLYLPEKHTLGLFEIPVAEEHKKYLSHLKVDIQSLPESSLEQKSVYYYFEKST
jgi:hypothetical protein